MNNLEQDETDLVQPPKQGCTTKVRSWGSNCSQIYGEDDYKRIHHWVHDRLQSIFFKGRKLAQQRILQRTCQRGGNLPESVPSSFDTTNIVA